MAILLPWRAIRPHRVCGGRRHLHPIVSSKSLLKIFNHALQYSCLRFISSHLAYFLGPSSTFPFHSVYEVLGILCTSDISTLKHLNCHSVFFLIGVRRTLPARFQREKGNRRVFICQSARLNQKTTWCHTVSPLTFKVHFALVGLIGCR